MAETAFNEYEYGRRPEERTTGSSPGQGGSMVDQAKEKAYEMTREAEEAMRSRAEQGSQAAGERVHSTAEDLRSVSDTLRERGRAGAAQALEQMAGQADHFSSYLRSSDVDKVYDDFRNLARRQPWAIALGGIAVGLLAARVIRAAGSEETAILPPVSVPYQATTPPAATTTTERRHLIAVPEPGATASSPQAPSYRTEETDAETPEGLGTFERGFGIPGSPQTESPEERPITDKRRSQGQF